MFRYAYDKNKVFGLKFSGLQLVASTRLITTDIQEPCQADFDLLDKLATHQLVGSQARSQVLEHCREHGILVMLICNKDLACGVSATTVNQVFPDLIPEFKLQLAKEVAPTKLRGHYWAETKYDGVRLALTNVNGLVEAHTRNGKLVNLPRLQAALAPSAVQDYMLDCEVTLKSGKMEDRSKVSGMVTSAMRGGVINEGNLVFNVFDCMPVAEFFAHSCPSSYHHRREETDTVLRMLNVPQLQLAERWSCHCIGDVLQVYNQHIDQGFEGLILKHEDSKYLFKRSTEWIKMKETKTADLHCSAAVEGEGKYQGQIGALVCSGMVDNKMVHVKVGTGLTDADRERCVQAYVGQTIEVKYNSVVQDKTTEVWSLFLPRFVCVRTDK